MYSFPELDSWPGFSWNPTSKSSVPTVGSFYALFLKKKIMVNHKSTVVFALFFYVSIFVFSVYFNTTSWVTFYLLLGLCYWSFSVSSLAWLARPLRMETSIQWLPPARQQHRWWRRTRHQEGINRKGPRWDQWQGHYTSSIMLYSIQDTTFTQVFLTHVPRKVKTKIVQVVSLLMHFESHRRSEANTNEQIW